MGGHVLHVGERARGRRQAREHGGGEQRGHHEDDLALDEAPEQDGRRRVAAAWRRGFVRARFTPASTSAASEQADLPEQRLAVRGLPERSERRDLEQRLAGPGPDQEQHRAEGHRGEARHDVGEHGRPARAADREPEHDEPDQAAEPDRDRPQVGHVQRQREASRRLLPGVAGEGGEEERGHSARRARPAARAARRPSGARARAGRRTARRPRRPRTGRTRARGRGSPARSSSRARPGRSRPGRTPSEV